MPRSVNRVRGTIDPGNAVERDHPLNANVTTWWVAPAGLGAGGKLRDFIGGVDLSGVGGTAGFNGVRWSSQFQGMTSVMFDGTQTLPVTLTTPLALPFTVEYFATVTGLAGGASPAVLSPNTLLYYVGYSGGLVMYGNGLVSGAYPAVGNLVHRVTSYTGTTAFNYVDGKLVSSPAFASVAALSAPQIGGVINGNAGFNGLLYSLRLRSGALSSADEAAALYQQAQQGYPDLLRWQPTSRSFVFSTAVPYFLPAFAA